MSIRSRAIATVDVIKAAGELDLHTAPARRAAANGRCHLVVDLSEVTFLDSTALGALRVLVACTRRAKLDDGDLDLVVTRPHLRKIFHITSLHTVIAIHPTLEDALPRHTAGPLGPRQLAAQA